MSTWFEEELSVAALQLWPQQAAAVAAEAAAVKAGEAGEAEKWRSQCRSIDDKNE